MGRRRRRLTKPPTQPAVPANDKLLLLSLAPPQSMTRKKRRGGEEGSMAAPEAFEKAHPHGQSEGSELAEPHHGAPPASRAVAQQHTGTKDADNKKRHWVHPSVSANSKLKLRSTRFTRHTQHHHRHAKVKGYLADIRSSLLLFVAR